MTTAVAPLRGTARLRHWWRIPRRELSDVLAAEVALLRAQVAAWLRPRGRLVRPHETREDRIAQAAATATTAATVATVAPLDVLARTVAARRAVTALDRALRYGVVRPACLVRSMALVRLLEREGVDGATIRLGVRRGADAGAAAEVDAHAWVELDGAVVGDDPRHTRRFTPLGSVSAVERR